MRRIISFILICSMLLAFLTGCSYFDKTNEGGDETNNNELGNGGNEAGDIETDNSNNQNNEENQKPKGEGTPIDKESDIIESLIKLLDRSMPDIDYFGSRLSEQIDLIKYGAQPLEVTFSPLDYYFIIGYYNEDPNERINTVQLAEKCNWYRFDSARDIPEYINGEKCVMTYQFNKASSVKNLLGNENAPEMEHLLWLDTQFENGYNITPPIAFAETIIFLQGYFTEDLNKSTIYYSNLAGYIRCITMRFIQIDSMKYIMVSRYMHENGELESLESALSSYYDNFMRVTNNFSYEGYLSDSATFIYTLIAMEHFIEVLKEVAPQN